MTMASAVRRIGAYTRLRDPRRARPTWRPPNEPRSDPQARALPPACSQGHCPGADALRSRHRRPRPRGRCGSPRRRPGHSPCGRLRLRVGGGAHRPVDLGHACGHRGGERRAACRMHRSGEDPARPGDQGGRARVGGERQGDRRFPRDPPEDPGDRRHGHDPDARPRAAPRGARGEEAPRRGCCPTRRSSRSTRPRQRC